MESQNKGNAIVRSALSGIGIAVLFLLVGTVLDYLVTQVLSQFVIADCSEDCYFRLFNSIFTIVALISLAAGIRSGVRTYRRSSG
jgi:hypothetical protein